MKTSPDHQTEPSDTELVHRTRSGDADAFGMLWTRHYRSGMTVARSITSRVEPEDLVQESYARILQAIRKGGGPNGAFRAYLFTSIRNTAAVWGRAPREDPLDDAEVLADPETTAQSAEDALDRSLTAQAFRSLPSRWQEVLWYTEIEQMKPAQAGVLLGMSAGAVSQLAFRAREGLREAWIQAHLRNVEDDSECRWAITSMGAYARGNLSARDRKRMDAHFQECARCMIVAAEAEDVSRRLALVLLPLVLGVAGAGTYLATLQTGSAPAVAVAAMPPGLWESVHAAPAMPVSAGASTGGVAAGAGAATGGGALGGIGVLVGAGTAALVVAGAVAAATVLPGILPAPTTASLAQASADHSLSIEADVAPDADIERTVMTPGLPETDEKSDAPTPAPSPVPPIVPSSPAEQPSGADRPTPTPPPVAPEEPAGPGEAPGEPEGEPTPGEPGTEEPGTEEPGTEEPGTEEPTPEEPGTEEPVPEEPVPEEPTPEEPTPDEPTPDEPGTGQTPTDDPEPSEPESPEPVTPTPDEPAGPTTAITWSKPTVTIGLDGRTRIAVPVFGSPDAPVDGWIGSSGGGSSVTLDGDGAGTIELRPTAVQLLRGTTVTFRYASGDSALTSTTNVHTLLAAALR